MTKPSADWRPLVGLPGERPPVPGIPNPIVVRARAEETGGAFEVYEVGLAGEGTDLVAGPPPTTHREHEEIFYVLEGEVEFTLGEDRSPAPTGTLIVIPRGIRHHFRGRPGSRLLVFSIPAGLAGYLRRARARPRGRPNGGRHPRCPRTEVRLVPRRLLRRSSARGRSVPGQRRRPPPPGPVALHGQAPPGERPVQSGRDDDSAAGVDPGTTPARARRTCGPLAYGGTNWQGCSSE